MEFKKYDHSKEEKVITDYWIKNKCFAPKKNLVLMSKKSKLSFLHSSVAQLVEQLTVNRTISSAHNHLLVVKQLTMKGVSKCSYSLIKYQRIVCS